MKTKRAARVAVLLVVGAAMVTSAVTGCGTSASEGRSRSQHPAQPTKTFAPADIEAAIANLLVRRSEAVDEGDEQAWLATVSERAREEQAAAFTRVTALPLANWGYGQPKVISHTQDIARLTVPLHYRLTGDDRDATVVELLEVSPRDAAGEDWLIDVVTASPLPPWDLEGVSAYQSKSSLVVGAASEVVLQRYATEADRAVAAIDDIWNAEWHRRLVVFVPDSWANGRRMMGAPGHYDGYAALTGPLEPADSAPGPVRILANDQVLSGLSPATRQAVLTHEAFHAATWGSGPVPKWLSEGIGDYIGYRDSGIPVRQALSGLLDAARGGSLPEVLPNDSEFTGGRQASVAYEGAHLAARMLMRQYGAGRVVTFYGEAAERPPEEFAQAFRRKFGISVDRFTNRWRREIERLAR